MPNTVIYPVNLLGKYLQELLVFTNCKGQTIRDGDVDLTGVDGAEDGDENDSPLKIENKNDLDYQEDQVEVHTEQENQTIIQQPIKLELEPP